MTRRNASWVGQVLAWCVILGAVAVLVVAVLVPRLAGATPYNVLTGSMRPTYPPGTLVVVRSVAPADVAIGDVVTYQLTAGEAEVVTHRVVAIGNDGQGERSFQTQGDTNEAPDEEWVRPVQLKGELWYAVPYLGHVNDLVNGRQRQMAVYVVASLLLCYAAFMFTGSVRDRGRSREEAETDEEIRVG